MATKKVRPQRFFHPSLLLLFLDPEWIKIRIRYKHPGSATPVKTTENKIYIMMIPVLEFRLDGGRGFGSEEDLLGQLVEAASSRPILTRRGKQERADKSGPKSERQPQHFSFLRKIFFFAVLGIKARWPSCDCEFAAAPW